jgi:hypothetical protein
MSDATTSLGFLSRADILVGKSRSNHAGRLFSICNYDRTCSARPSAASLSAAKCNPCLTVTAPFLIFSPNAFIGYEMHRAFLKDMSAEHGAVLRNTK